MTTPSFSSAAETRLSLGQAPRSLLFVPGDRPERFAKAASSGADAVIIDLEDSVPAAHKARARAHVVDWLASNPVYVRVGAAGTADFDADLAMLAGTRAPAAVVLPKAESPDQVEQVAARVGRDVPVIALVESAAGLMRAAAIVDHRSVGQLAFGNLDFAADCGITVRGPDELELLATRSHLVWVSRAAGLPGPIDGVTADVTDDTAVEHDTTRAARLGFTGKLCVHPRQVDVVHRALRPSAQEIAWAERVLDSVSEGVAVVDGSMVDRPVLLRAQWIRARANV